MSEERRIIGILGMKRGIWRLSSAVVVFVGGDWLVAQRRFRASPANVAGGPGRGDVGPT